MYFETPGSYIEESLHFCKVNQGLLDVAGFGLTPKSEDTQTLKVQHHGKATNPGFLWEDLGRGSPSKRWFHEPFQNEGVSGIERFLGTPFHVGHPRGRVWPAGTHQLSSSQPQGGAST